MSVLALVLWTTIAYGQTDPHAGPMLPPGHPPTGPAQIIGQAMERVRTPDAMGHAEQAAPNDAAHRIARGELPALSVAEPREGIASGTIAITVVNAAGQPVPAIEVELGVMRAADQQRERRNGRTDAAGAFSFTGLPTGTQQAYRVNVAFQGAKYSSTPFQLPLDRGYAVRITALPTTRNERTVLQVVGQTMLELKDGRLHVTQQSQLMNLGEETYLFPEAGLDVRLPAGFTAFQTEPLMTDQRVIPFDEGLRLHGSLPPGRVTLLWAFDLPLSGGSMDFSLPVPFRTYVARVISDAPLGMELDVDGMDDPQVHEDDGRRVMVTELERAPTDAPLEQVRIQLRGIPGPGPWRWLALGGALVLLLGGGLLLTLSPRPNVQSAEARANRRQALLDEAASVERMFAAQEIGPKFRTTEIERLTTALALALRDDSQTKLDPKRA